MSILSGTALLTKAKGRIGLAVAFVALATATPSRAQGRIHTVHGSAGDQMGISVSGAGDIDQDGYADFLTGAPFAYYNGQQTGLAHVYSGRDGSLIYSLHGTAAGDMFGTGVSYLSDLDGDAVVDILIGAPQTLTTLLGYLQVFSGKTGQLVHTVQGWRAYEQLGAYVANLGDVNADGVPDFAGGAPAFIGEIVVTVGTVLVCSGADGSIIYDFRGDDRGGFGYYMRNAGDVDKDGVSDIIAGAPFDSTTQIRSGMAVVYSGKDGSVIHKLYGDHPYAHFGVSNDGLGDLDLDGYHDFVVGAYASNFAGPVFGSAWVYSGKDGTVLYGVHGDSSVEDFGFALSSLRDINGDGFKDLVVGARFDNAAAPGAGTAHVFSGPTGNKLYEAWGSSTGDQLGKSMKYTADVNKDGFNDFVVGAYKSSENGADAGKTVVFAGDDLFTNVVPKIAVAGDTLTLSTAEGVPGAPTLIVAVEVNGFSRFHVILGVGTFDSTGKRVISAALPADVSNVSVKFRSYAINAAGRIIDSRDELVLIQ